MSRSWNASWVGFVALTVLAFAVAVPLPPIVALSVGLAAMGTVLLAWLRLRRDAAAMPVARLYRIAIAWCVPLAATRTLFSGDVRSYIAQGVIAARGLDPYRLGPAQALGRNSSVTEKVSHYWRDTPAPYGPVSIAVSRFIARLAGGDFLASVVCYRLVALAGLLLIGWALPRLAARCGVSPGTALWLGLLNPLLLWHVVADVHNDGPMLGLLLAGMEIALGGLHRRSVAGLGAGMLLLTVAANVKIVAAAALLCLGAETLRRWGTTPGRRMAIVAGFVAVPAAGTAALSAGSGLGFGWVGAMSASTSVHSWLAPTNALGFLISLGGINASSSITGVMTVGAIAGAVAAVVLLRRVLEGRLDVLRGLGLLFAAAIVCGPVVQPWYVLWAVVPLAATIRDDRSCRLLAAVSLGLAVALPPVVARPLVLVAGYLIAAAFLLLARFSSGLVERATTTGTYSVKVGALSRRADSPRRSAGDPLQRSSIRRAVSSSAAAAP